jgi:hypothetical protein
MITYTTRNCRDKTDRKIANTDRKNGKIISLYRQENTGRAKAIEKFNFTVGRPIYLSVHHFPYRFCRQQENFKPPTGKFCATRFGIPCNRQKNVNNPTKIRLAISLGLFVLKSTARPHHCGDLREEGAAARGRSSGA